ncbi:MAG: hypothetical protein ACTSU5_10305 [Promethearchaeota archaeon]
MKARPSFAPEITLRVTAEVTGDDDRTLQNSRGKKMKFDETEDFRGKGLHWSADEFFLSSVLASLGNTFLFFARRRKKKLGEFRLSLGGRSMWSTTRASARTRSPPLTSWEPSRSNPGSRHRRGSCGL